jgi:hypothetical protein
MISIAFLSISLNQIREINALCVGLIGEVDLHLLIEVHRQLEDRARLVELTTLALGKVVLTFHHRTFGR